MPALRVMSFNVRGSSYPQDGANQWKYRAGLNARTILRHAPDLIGFQELQGGNLLTYRRELPGYNYLLGRRYNNEEPFNYPAIYWRPRRLRLLAWGAFWLNTIPDQPLPDWDAELVRSANWARFMDLLTGQTFLHLNSHLDHQSERARVEGGKLILRRLEELRTGDESVVVTGDFNSHPESEVYRLFAEAGYRDAYLVAGNTEAPTAHAFQGRWHILDPSAGTGRIDWILTRDGPTAFRVLSCSIITDAEPPLYPSDHYPVQAGLSAVSGQPSAFSYRLRGRWLKADG